MLVAVLALGFSSGCSASELSCSEPTVLATLKEAARKALAQDEQFEIFDAQASSYEVNAIRTVACGERACVCKASLRVSLELREGYKHPEQVQDMEGILTLTQPYYRNREPSFEIGYTAEMTDAGDQVYVTLQGM